MQGAGDLGRPTLLPVVRYRDPERAIEWLVKALGFETRCVAKRADGSFAYAHLACGDSLIMVTPARGPQTQALLRLPKDANAPGAPGCYFVVDNIVSHAARAKSAGAEIVLDIKTYEHGGCRYALRDPERHIWTFGTYDPWKDKAAPSAADARPRRPLGEWTQRAGVAAAALALAAFMVPVWRTESAPPAPVTTAPAEVALERTREELAQERAAREAAETARREALATLSTERAARQVAEHSIGQLNAELASARSARTAAEAVAQDLSEHLAREAEARSAPSQGTSEVALATAPPAPRPASNAEPAAPVPDGTAVNPLLADGQAALAKGDLAAARSHFKRLADQGVPEAALALGSTYDPVNIARAGLADSEADRARAKEWYRRAIELAQAANERRPAP